MAAATHGMAREIGLRSAGNEDKMRRFIELFLLGAVLLAQPFLFAQSTIVTATKVLDNTGALLSSGKLCVGSACFIVTNGAINSTALVSTTANITVTNGGSITYLTLPNVAVAGPYWSFDNYIVPGSASITGIGTPRIACQPGAIYTQADGDQNKWVCVDINGVGTWNGVLPTPNGGGGGTVTSIGISLPSIFCVTGSPITSAGTIIASLCNQPANTVFAGPPSGTATFPMFRSLAVADMPFSYSGNSTKLATVSGGLTQGLALTADANGNIITAGSGTVLPGTITAAQVSGLAASATIDTTNASNITSGTLSLARLPSSLFSCPTGQAVGSFTLNNSTPICIPFQGVIATGLQFEIPIYSIAGGGTTLSASLATIDTSGNLTAASIALTGSVAQNQFLGSPNGSAGAPVFRSIGTADLPGALQNTVASQSANLMYASPTGSTGIPGFRSIVTGDLPFTYSGNTTELGTVSGTFTAGHGLTTDANGNIIDSGSAPGTILASTSFTSCAPINYGSSDHNCAVSAQSWGSTLPNSSYKTICTIEYPFAGGGSDPTSMSQSIVTTQNKTTTSFGYTLANIHDASTGRTVTIDCVAIQ